MTQLKIFLLLIVCAFSAQAANARNSKMPADELHGKRIGVIGDCDMRRWRTALIMSLSLADIMMLSNWILSEELIISKIKWRFCVKDWSRNIRRRKYSFSPVCHPSLRME